MSGSELHSKTLPQLRALAKAQSISGVSGLKKADLIARLLESGKAMPSVPSDDGGRERAPRDEGPSRREPQHGAQADPRPVVESSPSQDTAVEPSSPAPLIDLDGEGDDDLKITMRSKDGHRTRDRRDPRGRGRLGGRTRRGSRPDSPAPERWEDPEVRVEPEEPREPEPRVEYEDHTEYVQREERAEPPTPDGYPQRDVHERRDVADRADRGARDRGARHDSRSDRGERPERSERPERRPVDRERRQAPDDGRTEVAGALEVLPEGRGFLRREGYSPSPHDVYVSESQIRRFGLRTGDWVIGEARPPRDGTSERYFSLLRIESVNGQDPDGSRERIDFENLTPIFPEERFRLEVERNRLSTRIIDIIAPIGKGQRGLIVAPPKAGKTTILKDMAHAIITNHPDVYLMVLLVDERPEEVTDIQRAVADGGQVIASTFDQVPENHMRAADFTLERAKRLVEHGRDVVVLLDSLTRLARASNLTVTPSGRTLSGGLDPAALYKPKRFLGAARKAEEGGSLTIMATVLIETGSRMDEMIYEEFKATGNMEVTLDRGLAERRIWPAIDVRRSSTRHHELLYSAEELKQTSLLIRALAALEGEDATRTVIRGLKQTPNNERFLMVANELLRREAAAVS